MQQTARLAPPTSHVVLATGALRHTSASLDDALAMWPSISARFVFILALSTTVAACSGRTPSSVEPARPPHADAGGEGNERDATASGDTSDDAVASTARCAAAAGAKRGRFVATALRRRAPEAGSDAGSDDLAFDVRFDGPVLGFAVANVAASVEAYTPGTDLYEVTNVFPIGQKHVATLRVSEEGRPRDEQRGPLPMGEGRHRLTLHVSGQSRTPAPWRIFAILADCSIIEGPTIR